MAEIARKRNTFPKGTKVRCERAAPAKGGWRVYAGREGTVQTPDNDGEVGVTFGAPGNHSAATWFLPTELVRIQ